MSLQLVCFSVDCGTLLIKTEQGNVVFLCQQVNVIFNDLLIEGCFYRLFIGIGKEY